MFKRIILVAVALSCSLQALADPPESINQDSNSSERTQLPMKIGNVNIIRGNLVHRSGIVLDDQGTAYILSILSNQESNLLRISQRHAVKELIMYRGWPYILDKRGRLYAFDVSWKTSFKNKIPYIALRSIRTLPLAIGIGIGSYGLALMDATFTGILSIDAFQTSNAFWSAFMLYYGLDIAHTVFLTSHRTINRGGNFFTELLEKGVTSAVADPSFDDFIISAKRFGSSHAQVRNLSHLAPDYAGQSSCLEYLTKMGMR